MTKSVIFIQPIFGSAAQGRNAVEQVASGAAPPIMGGGPVQKENQNLSAPSGPASPINSNSNISADDSSQADCDALAEALALLMSHEPVVATASISTSLKVLSNLVANFGDEKYHKVRLANKVSIFFFN